MALKVTVPLSNNINTSIVSKKTASKVETLADVDTANLQDGYTLIYNSVTGKWEASNPATEVVLDNIDCGTY